MREESQHQLALRYAGGRSERSLDFEHDRYVLQDNARRFQFGPWSWPLVHAWATAADWLEGIGLPAINTRTAALTGWLQNELGEIPSATMFTPLRSQRSAAIVSFGLEGWTGESLSNTLRQRWNIIVKPLPHTREGLRISIPFFILESEIGRLADAVRKLGANTARDGSSG